MSEYARRNLVCQSWHRCPEGWQSYSGMSSGYTKRPFCTLEAGHVGDHRAGIEHEETMQGQTIYDVMTWPNTLGIPAWLKATMHHGLEVLGQRSRSRSDSEALNHLQDWLDELD